MAEMRDQPLWLDISSHQGNIDFDKIAAVSGSDYVHGIFSRAGWGSDGGYLDSTFNRNWVETKRIGRYRASYWAYWDYFPLQTQLDRWFKANPEIDFIPRMWDMEKEMAPAEFLAEQTWLASEKVKERDGKRFIIYTRKSIMERTLCKYWTPEMLNEHYYMLAQYDKNNEDDPSTIGEYNGIYVPTNVNPKNVVWKQTCSIMPIYQASGYVDRDRWIWTDAPTMEDQITEMWGAPDPTPDPDPEPDPGCDCITLRADIDKNTANIKTLGDVLATDEEVWAEAKKYIVKLSEDTVLLTDKVNKLEIQLNKDIAALRLRIDGLAGGHDHPAWIKNFGWAYPVEPKDDEE